MTAEDRRRWSVADEDLALQPTERPLPQPAPLPATA